ncbi:MAG TPA: TMEM165/GDT1 family protein [Patescibacteria group bacterium]|nr:TMEM165/GDT1 family protein [Patescibacteria group bacterium]
MWKIFLTTFGVMFLAEIGDKTQLAVISLTSRYRSPLVVFAAAALAMVAATAIGVVLGRFVPVLFGANVVRIVSGGLFVLFGVLILFGK